MTMTPKQRAVLKELVRRQQRPYLHYKPGPTQAAFFACPALYKALHGPNRGGKTFHIDMEAAMLMEDRHPRLKNVRNRKFLFVVPGRQTAGTVHKEYFTERSRLKGPCHDIPMLDMSETIVHLDRTKHPHAPRQIINTRTGNSILFIWASSGRTAQNLLEGSQFDGAFIDESAGTQVLLDEVKLRLLDAQADPDRPGMGFIWWGFTETKINQAGSEFLAACYDNKQKDYMGFRIASDENPAISKKARTKMGKGMSERARKIRIEGTSSAQGEVAIYPVLQDPEKKKLLFRESCYAPMQDDNVCIAFDPGVDHPCGIMFAYLNKYRPRKLQIFHFENNSNEGPREVIDHIRRVLCGRKIAHFAYDPFGASRREFGTGKSAISQIAELIPESWWAPGHPVFKQPKGRHMIGINAVRQYLDPPSSVSQYPLIEFDPPTETNGMATAIAQLTDYRGREDLNFAGPHGVVKINDEACDNIRHLVLTDPHWVDYGPNIASFPQSLPLPNPENRIGYMELGIVEPDLTDEQRRLRDQMERSKEIANRRKGRRRR